jgi:hypothetical protein
MKKRLAKVLIPIGLAAFLAGCASPPPPEPDYPPPPRKQADAKTQLESGRRY